MARKKVEEKPARKPAVIIDVMANGVIRRKPGPGKRPKLKASKSAKAEAALRWRNEAGVIAERKRAESQRIKDAKARRSRQLAVRAETVVMIEEGRQRTVRKVKSVLDKTAQLPKSLRVIVDAFCRQVADSNGVATIDGEDSTNRQTGAYEAGGNVCFGSKTLADKQIAGSALYKLVKVRIPFDFLSLFDQIVSEEIGTFQGKPKTLAQIGENFGFLHKQASAAASMAIIATCTIIAHSMREFADLADVGEDKMLLTA